MRGKAMIPWCAALAALLAVILFVNLPGAEPPEGADPGARPGQTEPDRPAGAAVGEKLPDFSVACLDGTRFTLSEHAGKTVVVNLWATWCAPCVRELAYFDRLQRENPDDVSVLALHSELVTQDVEEYLAGRDYSALAFAVAPDESLTALLNGSTVLPQTIVIAPDGTVTYNKTGSLTYEALTALVAEAAG